MQREKNVSEDLKEIAKGPTNLSFSFEGYVINRNSFNTKFLDDKRFNQNGNVSIVASTMKFLSAKDKNLVYGKMTYCRVVIEIWKIDYRSFINFF